jgi:hypothetical protein
MKTIAYLAGALAIGVFAAGASVAQTEELKGSSVQETLKPTPAKYAIGTQPSYEDVTRSLAEQGFEVIGYEQDDRRIEVHGLTATGHCLELKFNAANGKEVRRERDDDCRPGDDFDD